MSRHGEEADPEPGLLRHLRPFREAQRAGYELLLQLQATQPWPDVPEQTAPGPAEEAVAADFLPPDLRVPSRQEVAGLMMRWLQPLIIEDEVRTCPGCGAYRGSLRSWPWR